MFEDFSNNFSGRLLAQSLIFLLGLFISGFGLFQLFSNSISAASSDVDESAAQICTKDPEFGRLTVDIGGAVKNPGVYELEIGSRINDLVNISGGFSNSVDKYYINKVLNLSQRLNDGEKIYIPTLEESIESQQNNAIGSGSVSNNGYNTKLVSINSASIEELMSLKGIGEKRSEDIIAQRPYESLEQLVEKDILTESTFDSIKNDVSL